ncbi:aliphatic sulfonate ABC transporter substrate-binding protein [Nostoc sp. FACHB-133]|uniref:aliphatic sulfonate ABC transporter substrate-binding protein n=1 Tax=Nostoc sp. FACHB-133 TaxID=2692835 RepID=UPI00168889BF|nr:aliphatic sulfonate ABC transporter substrate-binding protein [Nostoc sp. FACHB-133]MBD2523633.1 aliphatic sulfonate ABC transporter substrate-binding protein [Nostoc sp. FACHB-133]
MAFFKDLQQFDISINKPIKSKIENLKPFLPTINLISNKSLAIKAEAKYKIERNYLSLLVAAFSLTIPMSIVGCSQENKTTQNEASAISTETQNQSVSNTPQKQEVRVISSKLGSLAVMRKQGTLEKSLAAKNFTVKWLEFAAGPQALEALNAGSLDIAATAESPPIFAQAAGTPLVYVVTTAFNGKGVSFLVPKNSPIKSAADFKGKKVSFQKASIAHYVLLKALQKDQLKLTDVQSIFLPPPDANVAFSQGGLDVWVTWEPYITRALQKNIGRVLIDGQGLQDLGGFYSTSRKFAKEHPEVLKIFLEELTKADEWSKKNPDKLAELVSPDVGIDVPTLKKIQAKSVYGLLPITEEVINKQQKIADLWYSQGLLPKKVNVRDGVLTPEEYAAFIPESIKSK